MGSQPTNGTLSAGVAATILAANDNPARTWLGRDQLIVWNSGPTNPMNVAIGQTATSADILIQPLDCFILKAEGIGGGGGSGLVPADYISAYSAGGTTYVVWSG